MFVIVSDIVVLGRDRTPTVDATNALIRYSCIIEKTLFEINFLVVRNNTVCTVSFRFISNESRILRE